MGSSSLTRNWTHVPLHLEHGVLATGPPGKSLFIIFKFISGCGGSSLLHWLFSPCSEQGLWILYIKYLNLAGACLETGVLMLLVLVSAQHSMSFLFPAVLICFCCTWTFSHCSQQELLSRCCVQASHCCSYSCCRTQALEHRLSTCVAQACCSERRGILPHQGANLCPVHWQVDSLPLCLSTEEIPVSFNQDLHVSFNWGAMYVNLVPYKIWCPQPITGWSETRRESPKLTWTCWEGGWAQAALPGLPRPECPKHRTVPAFLCPAFPQGALSLGHCSD